MKVLLIGVSYLQGKYLSTKTVTKMLESVGHELVSSPKEGVTIVLGKLMPFEAPKKPDTLLRAESLGLPVTDLDALMGVQAPPSVEQPAAEPPKSKGKGKRMKNKEQQAQVA